MEHRHSSQAVGGRQIQQHRTDGGYPAQASYRKMWQNLVWATGYNIIAVPLAAGVLAFAGVVLSPAAGAVLMSASTIVVALNARLLRRLKLDPAAVG